MNRKQVAALKPGEIVKAWRGGSGKYRPFEFEVVSAEVVKVMGVTTIKVKTMAWPAGLNYSWYMPPMFFDTGRTYGPQEEPVYQGVDASGPGDWKVDREVFIDTRYLRDVEVDADRARERSAQREQDRLDAAARRRAYDERHRAWRDWLRRRGAQQGTAHRGTTATMVVNLTRHEAIGLLGDLRHDTRFSMVFALDELGNVVGFGGGIGPE